MIFPFPGPDRPELYTRIIAPFPPGRKSARGIFFVRLCSKSEVYEKGGRDALSASRPPQRIGIVYSGKGRPTGAPPQ